MSESSSYSRKILSEDVAVDYERKYGVHNIQVDSDMVSIISAPDWKGYFESASDNLKQLGRHAISPELITSGLSFQNIALSSTIQKIIKSRVKDMVKLSSEAKGTTFILGTATFDKKSKKPKNSQIVIRRGKVLGQSDKEYTPPGSDEDVFFSQEVAAGSVSALGRTGLLVCSDLIPVAIPALSKTPILPPDSEQAFMSACWASPLQMGKFIAPSLLPDEERFRSQLEKCAAKSFHNNPSLRHLVIADRKPPGIQTDGPFNGHFYRLD